MNNRQLIDGIEKQQTKFIRCATEIHCNKNIDERILITIFQCDGASISTCNKPRQGVHHRMCCHVLRT